MTEQTEDLKIPTNKWVGVVIGYSESGASLIRRGKRRPSLALMRTVAEAIGWSMADQAEVEGRWGWAVEFEMQMRRAYTAELEGQA